MAIIEDLLTGVDATIVSVVAETYDPTVEAVLPAVQAGTVLLIILVGINLAVQTIPLTLNNSLSLAFRIILVQVFLQYGNVSTVYFALTNGPSDIGGTLLASMSAGVLSGDAPAATNPSLYEGLDRLYIRALDVGQALAQNGGFVAGAITSAFMFLIAAFMATVTIIVLSAAKIVLAVLLAIAPIMIAFTLFKQTVPIFESWIKLAIGLAFVPLLVAAMAGFTIATADAVTPPDLDTVETLGDAISFVVVMMLGAGLIVMVPGFANSLAATNTGIGAAASYASGAYQRNVVDRARGAAKTTGRATGGGAYGAATGKTLGRRNSIAAQRGSEVGAAVRNQAVARVQQIYAQRRAATETSTPVVRQVGPQSRGLRK